MWSVNCLFQYLNVLACYFLNFEDEGRCSGMKILNRSNRLTLLIHGNITGYMMHYMLRNSY